MSFVLNTLWNTMHEQTLNCSRHSLCEMLVKASGNLSSGGEATGEKGPATKLRTCGLHSTVEFLPQEPQNKSRSFVSHRSCARCGCVADCDHIKPKPSRLALVQRMYGSGLMLAVLFLPHLLSCDFLQPLHDIPLVGTTDRIQTWLLTLTLACHRGSCCCIPKLVLQEWSYY